MPGLDKLASVHSELHEWDRTFLKAPRKKIKELKRGLDQLLSGPINEDTTQQQKEVMDKIKVALEQEEVHYMQRSWADWLLHGIHTMFFHNFSKNENGVILETER